MLTFLVMTVVLSWENEGSSLESLSYRPLFLEHSFFLCHLGSVKGYAVAICAVTVHYYINAIDTNGDGSSNYSINNMSGM